jgi:hypothetical protein
MKTQWQIYKELELIPDSVSVPPANNLAFAMRLSQVWRSLLDTATKKPLHEQQIEYLERCLALDCSNRSSNVWQQFWAFLNQPLVLPKLSASGEPQVWQSLDRAGQTWWHVYDPTTGQMADLESEEEVCIWLEERLYRYF